MGQRPEETRPKLLSAPLSGVSQDKLNSSSNDVCRQVCNVANQGSSTEPGWGWDQSVIFI